MEELNNFLIPDEKILWKRTAKKDIISLDINGFYLVIALIFIDFAFLFLMISLSTEYWDDFFTASIYAVIFMVILIPILISIIFDYKLKTVRFTMEELRNYEVIEILTNYRYFRRDFQANKSRKSEYEEYSDEVLELHKDIFFLNLSSIQVVFIESTSDSNEIAICLYPEWDEEQIGPTPLYFNVSFDDYHRVLKLIKQIIPFGRKEKDQNGTTYYRAREGKELIDDLDFSIEKDKEQVNICPHCGEDLFCQSCGKKIN